MLEYFKEKKINFKCELHSLENHNFFIKRYGKCPYCDSGSKPVHKSIIAEKYKDYKHKEL